MRLAQIGIDEVRMTKVQVELLKSRKKYEHKENLKMCRSGK